MMSSSPLAPEAVKLPSVQPAETATSSLVPGPAGTCVSAPPPRHAAVVSFERGRVSAPDSAVASSPRSRGGSRPAASPVACASGPCLASACRLTCSARSAPNSSRSSSPLEECGARSPAGGSKGGSEGAAGGAQLTLFSFVPSGTAIHSVAPALETQPPPPTQEPTRNLDVDLPFFGAGLSGLPQGPQATVRPGGGAPASASEAPSAPARPDASGRAVSPSRNGLPPLAPMPLPISPLLHAAVRAADGGLAPPCIGMGSAGGPGHLVEKFDGDAASAVPAGLTESSCSPPPAVVLPLSCGLPASPPSGCGRGLAVVSGAAAEVASPLPATPAAPQTLSSAAACPWLPAGAAGPASPHLPVINNNKQHHAMAGAVLGAAVPLGASSSSGAPGLVPATGDVEKSRTSFVWRYFTIMKRDDAEENAVLCNLCRVKFKTSTSTSSLAYHLLRMHQITPPAAASKQENGGHASTGAGGAAAGALGGSNFGGGAGGGGKGGAKTGAGGRGGSRGGAGGGGSAGAGQQSLAGSGSAAACGELCGSGGGMGGESERFRGGAGGGAARSAEATRHLLNFFVEDLRDPFLVTGVGFRELIHFLDPQYRLPDVSACVGLIQEEYATLKHALRREISAALGRPRPQGVSHPATSAGSAGKGGPGAFCRAGGGGSLPAFPSCAEPPCGAATAGSVALSLDLWRRRGRQVGLFVTVSAHYRSAVAGGVGGKGDQDLLTRVLATRELDLSASPEALLHHLRGLQNEWGLFKPPCYVVTFFAGSPALRSAVERLGWRPVDCFLTTLNLCVCRDAVGAVPEVVEIVAKCRATVERWCLRLDAGGSGLGSTGGAAAGLANAAGAGGSSAAGVDSPQFELGASGGQAGGGAGAPAAAGSANPVILRASSPLGAAARSAEGAGTGHHQGVSLFPWSAAGVSGDPAEWLELARQAAEEVAACEALFDWRCRRDGRGGGRGRLEGAQGSAAALAGEDADAPEGRAAGGVASAAEPDGGAVAVGDLCVSVGWRHVLKLLSVVNEMQGHALSHAFRDSGSEDLLTEEEQQLLAELVVFLRTFKDAADVLSDSDQSTISLVFPTLRALKRLCVRPSLTAPMHALRSKLLGALERRFAESEHEIFLTATLLDLRFKHMVDRDREWKVAFLRQALRNTRERPPVPPAPPVGGAVGAQERARPPCSQAPFAAAGAEAPATLNGALSGESPDAGGRPKSAGLAAAAGGHSGVFAVSPGAWLGATNGSPVSNAPQPGDPSSSPAFPALAGAAAGAVASANGAASAGLVPAAAAGATSGTASSPPVAGHGVGSLELPRQRTPAAGSGGNGGGGGATTPGGGRGQKGQRHLAGGGGNEAAGAGSMQLAVALAAQQAKKRRLLDFYAILYEGEEEVRFQPAAAGVDGGPGGQGGAEHTEEEEGEAADEEIGRYLDASCVRSRHMEGLSILQWWKINGVQFPRLARLALTLLVVPAGSLAAGDLEEKRARLSGPLVDQLLFLNRNRRAC